MIRGIPAVAFVLFALSLSPLTAQPKKGGGKPDDGPIVIKQKINLQEAWVYEIEVTSKGIVQMTLWTPPKVEKKGGTASISARPITGTSSFDARPGPDGKPMVTSSRSKIRQFVDYGQGGDFDLLLNFDRKSFSGEYTLSVRAVVTR